MRRVGSSVKARGTRGCSFRRISPEVKSRSIEPDVRRHLRAWLLVATCFCASCADSGLRENDVALTSVAVIPPPNLTAAPTPTEMSRMTIQPATVDVGKTIRVRFDGPLEAQHGAYYYLKDVDGNVLAGLWSDKFVEEGVVSPGYTTDLENFVILDFPVRDRTPDTLVLPPSVGPGRYALCTANSRPDPCTEFEVV